MSLRHGVSSFDTLLVRFMIFRAEGTSRLDVFKGF